MPRRNCIYLLTMIKYFQPESEAGECCWAISKIYRLWRRYGYRLQTITGRKKAYRKYRELGCITSKYHVVKMEIEYFLEKNAIRGDKGKLTIHEKINGRSRKLVSYENMLRPSQKRLTLFLVVCLYLGQRYRAIFLGPRRLKRHSWHPLSTLCFTHICNAITWLNASKNWDGESPLSFQRAFESSWTRS